MRSRLLLLVWFIAVWIALWEDLSVGNVIGGALVGVLLLLGFRSKFRGGPTLTVRPWALVRFVGYFLRRMVVANVLVTAQVLSPRRNAAREGILAVPVRYTAESVLAIMANAISLVPGTLILEITRNPTVLYIHMLHIRSIEQELLDIYRLERHAALAFGTRASVDDIDERIAELTARTAAQGEEGP